MTDTTVHPAPHLPPTETVYTAIPLTPAPAAPGSVGQPAAPRRTGLGGGAIAGIAVGAFLAVVLLFGGGLATGLGIAALSGGFDGPTTTQFGPGPGGFTQDTRPDGAPAPVLPGD